MTIPRDNNGERDITTRETVARVRASSVNTQLSVGFDHPQETVHTAEIPTVRPRSVASAPPRYVAAARPAAYPLAHSEEREPAPGALRLLVWLLFFLLILLAAAFAAEMLHPDWLSFLRNVVATPHGLGVARASSSL